MTPQRPDLVLSANVPHIEFDVLVRDGFDVEPDGGDSGHALVQLQFVEYRCCWRRTALVWEQRIENVVECSVGRKERTGLAGSIQSQH